MHELQEIVSQFSGKNIRVIDEMDDFWIPIVDIANAIGYNDRNLRATLSRNVELFKDFNRGITLTRRDNGQSQEVICVNEQGFYMILAKINTNQIESEVVRNAIIEFNRWMVNEIKRIREDRAVKLTPMATPAEVFKSEMYIASTIQEYLNLDKTLMMVTAISRTEKLTGMEMSEYKNILPPVVGPVSIMTATDIGKRLDMKAPRVNQLLMDLGLHYKNGKQWELTEEGKKYGTPYFENINHENGSTWQGVVNKWSPHVIEMIKDITNHP